jgi:DASH complex subunit SPC19
MRQSLAHLDTTVTVLDAGVADLPRVGGVLAAVRVSLRGRDAEMVFFFLFYLLLLFFAIIIAGGRVGPWTPSQFSLSRTGPRALLLLPYFFHGFFASLLFWLFHFPSVLAFPLPSCFGVSTSFLFCLFHFPLVLASPRPSCSGSLSTPFGRMRLLDELLVLRATCLAMTPRRTSPPPLTTPPSPPQHYELIPQPTLQAAEASLRDEIGPSIVLLLDRAERQLDRLARRVDTLKARSELQAGRLASTSSSAAAATTTTTGGVKRKAGNRLARADEARFKARALRARKDALLYSIQRLELEALQKEREHSRRAQ